MLAAGAITVPGELAFGRSPVAARVIQVPMAAEHVRHGLFAMRAVAHPSLPAWLQVFERHLFYGDGISRGDSDMYNFAFRAGDTCFTVVQKGSQMNVLVNDQCHDLGPERQKEVLLADTGDLKASACTYNTGDEIILRRDTSAWVFLNGSLFCEREVATGPAVIVTGEKHGQTFRALTPCAAIRLARA